MNAVLWLMYRRSAGAQGIGPLARRVLAQSSLPLHLAGHLLPALLVAGALLAPRIAPALFGIAGIAIVAGGVFWKFRLITRAGYQQGFALAKLPQRGSGTKAAPARLSYPPAPTQ